MPNQIVKNGQKTKFPQIAPNEKQLIKFSCTYQPLSFCKIFKKFQSYKVVPFSGPKWPICPEQNFFGRNHYYYFHLLIGPFHCAKFKKIAADPELWRCTILRSKMVHLPSKIFLGKTNITLIYLLACFNMQNFKKILPADPELWGCTIFEPKMAHFPKW